MLDKIFSGEKCPFEALIEINKQLDLLEDQKKQVLEIAIKQFSNECDGNQKTFKKYGHTFTQTRGGKYYYNHCDEWNDLSKQMKDIESKMQTAFNNNQSSYVNPDTGEVFEAAMFVPNKISISVK